MKPASALIRVSEIPDDGLSVGVDAIAVPFRDDAWRLETLSLVIERDGLDVLVRGRLAAVVPQACGRCLEPFLVRVAPEVDLRFAPRPDGRAEGVELGSDDLEVGFYANDQLDLAEVIETETTLALSMKPLCRDDCRGLCPVCGENRNVVECRCTVRAPDPRFAALKDLAARLSPQ